MSGTPLNAKLGQFLRAARKGPKTKSKAKEEAEADTENIPIEEDEDGIIPDSDMDTDTSEVPNSDSDTEPSDLDIPDPVMAGPQIKIMTFSGRPGENGIAWLERYTSQCINLFCYDDRVRATFPYYLTGQAESWFQSLPAIVRADPAAVEREFRVRFDGRDVPLSQLQLRQRPNEDAEEYLSRFLQATNHQDMPPEWLVSAFMDGLRGPTCLIVKPQHLESLEEARRGSPWLTTRKSRPSQPQYPRNPDWRNGRTSFKACSWP